VNEPACKTSRPLPDLLAYRLGEMDAASEAVFEEHLFGCARCSARLAGLEQLTSAIRTEFREGRLGSVFSAPFIRRLKDAGMRVREYRLQPGGSVNCTVGPEDDLVVAHLHAPLTDVRRLDLVLDGGEEDFPLRLKDIAFDPSSDEVAFASSVVELRKLDAVTLRAALFAVNGDQERMIASYVFNHSPYGAHLPLSPDSQV
jgi:hypothetical protein